MDIDNANPSVQPYTILRIKRKRNEEPLDALVVESGMPRKKSRAAMDIFQFAQTVEDDTWKDEARQRAIQDQIFRLSRETNNKSEQRTKGIVPTNSPGLQVSRSTEPSRRYTVIQQDTASPTQSYPTNPHTETASKTAEGRDGFKLIDAVPYTAPDQDRSRDSDMQKIQDLLDNYLNMEELKHPGLHTQSDPPEDDYVWDIFYRRPASMNPLPAGRAIGTLADFPASFMHDSDSDFEEEEDEADEDSNAEDNYKNEYPDEESSEGSSDEFHEHSEDDEYLDGENSDTEWR